MAALPECLLEYAKATAVRTLQARHMVILALDFSCAAGTVDTIARAGGALCLVDVDAYELTARVPRPEPARADQLLEIAHAWTASHNVTVDGIRLYRVIVKLGEATDFIAVDTIPNPEGNDHV